MIYEIKFETNGDIQIKKYLNTDYEEINDTFYLGSKLIKNRIWFEKEELDKVIYRSTRLFHSMFTKDDSMTNIQKLKNEFMSELQKYNEQKYKKMREYMETVLQEISDNNFWIEEIKNGEVLK
jgi:Zn-finger nucleic acid-binding protein